jgi:hypothetical protein
VAQRSSSKQSDRGEQTDRAKVKKVVPIRRQRSTEESEHLRNLSDRRKVNSSRTSHPHTNVSVSGDNN